jgi:hypothetical protein
MHITPHNKLCFYTVGKRFYNDEPQRDTQVSFNKNECKEQCGYDQNEGAILRPKLTPWRQIPKVYHHINNSQPTTCPYSEPTESTLHSLSKSPYDPFRSYLPIYAAVFRVVSFLQAFPPKPCTLFSPLSCIPHALPTSFSTSSA